MTDKTASMSLRFSVDQVRAIKERVPAPRSSAVISFTEFDLQNMQEHEVNILAALVREDGFDCTNRFLDTRSDPNNPTVSSRPGMPESYWFPFKIVGQSIAGVMRIISEFYIAAKEYVAEEAVNKAEQLAACVDSAESWITENEELNQYVFLSGDVAVISDFPRGDVYTTRMLPEVQQGADLLYSVDEATRDRLTAELDRRNVVKERILAEATIELKKQQEKKRAAEAEEKAAYDALYARLPAVMQARDKAGLTKSSEVLDALRALLCEDHGLPSSSLNTYEVEEVEYTDDETFAAFDVVPVPEGGTKTLVNASVVNYRPSTENDPKEEIDEEGEVVEISSPQLYAEIEFERAGILVTTHVPLKIKKDDNKITYLKQIEGVLNRINCVLPVYWKQSSGASLMRIEERCSTEDLAIACRVLSHVTEE